ncbi:MAG: hypothetical protein C0167_04590, partial [Nitrososphaera sp.]
VTATVAAMPYDCPPNARCIYCPGGSQQGTPKSYVQDSPAVVHASRLGYDPRAQVEERISVLERLGHPTSKVEVIIVGGTFLYYPPDYQMSFVKGVFEGLNGHSADSLEDAMTANELSAHRCVGLSLETRPDFCGEHHVDLMLSYGVTRVEIGVQALTPQGGQRTWAPGGLEGHQDSEGCRSQGRRSHDALPAREDPGGGPRRPVEAVRRRILQAGHVEDIPNSCPQGNSASPHVREGTLQALRRGRGGGTVGPRPDVDAAMGKGDEGPEGDTALRRRVRSQDDRPQGSGAEGDS